MRTCAEPQGVAAGERRLKSPYRFYQTRREECLLGDRRRGHYNAARFGTRLRSSRPTMSALCRLRSPRILLVRLSAIGDVIHGLPVLCALRERFPEAHLSWVVERTAAASLQGPSGVGRTGRAAPRVAEVAGRGLAAAPAAPRASAGGDDRPARTDQERDRRPAERLPAADRLRRREGTGAEPVAQHRTGHCPGGARHRRQSSVARAAGHRRRRRSDSTCPRVRGRPGGRPDDPRRRDAGGLRRDQSRGGLAVETLAGRAVRRRRPTPGPQLASAQPGGLGRRRGDRPGPRRSWPAPTATPGSPRPPRSRNWRRCVRRAALFVGSDTGPLHIAAAVGTPCVGLYGPMPATRNGPYGPRHVAIQKCTFEGTSRQRRAPARR